MSLTSLSRRCGILRRGTNLLYSSGRLLPDARLFSSKEEAKVPTLEQAKEMPLRFSEMTNDLVVSIAKTGHRDATVEMLKRHIMVVDNVDYDTACQTFSKIEAANKGLKEFLVYPYILGIAIGMSGAIGAIPMVFDLETALWFNEGYVTTDVPEPRDLETWLEVGSWSWNWMEPPLGTISFALLCLQFARAQIQNLGLRPYTSRVKKFRADRLASTFPQYDSELIGKYSEAEPLVNSMGY